MKENFYGKHLREGEAIGKLTTKNEVNFFGVHLLKDVGCKDLQ